jgi:hypothetical protein
MKLSHFLLLIPIGILVFVVYPQVEKQLSDYQKRVQEFKLAETEMKSLQSKENLNPKEQRNLKSLKFMNKISKIQLTKEKLLYYKIGGMLLLFILCFVYAMVGKAKLERYRALRKRRLIKKDFEYPVEDSIYQNISWEPAANGGSNFASSYLKRKPNGVLLIKQTSLIKAFSWCFLLVGLNYFGLSIYEYYALGKSASLGFMEIGALFFKGGGPFIIVGAILLFFTFPSTVISKRRNLVIAGGQQLKFQEVYAFQLLSELVGSSSGSYYSYELNLVTHKGERINIMDHGNKPYLIEDAMELATYFNVPIWNKI